MAHSPQPVQASCVPGVPLLPPSCPLPPCTSPGRCGAQVHSGSLARLSWTPGVRRLGLCVSAPPHQECSEHPVPHLPSPRPRLRAGLRRTWPPAQFLGLTVPMEAGSLLFCVVHHCPSSCPVLLYFFLSKRATFFHQPGRGRGLPPTAPLLPHRWPEPLSGASPYGGSSRRSAGLFWAFVKH